MQTAPMHPAYQQPTVAWALPAHGAVTLQADRAQVLWVHQGRVWLTRRCRRGSAHDVWLGAGERVLLPAGSEWVAEAWPSASVSLVLAAPRRVNAGGRLFSLGRLVSAWQHALPVPPAEPGAPRAA